MNSPAWPGKQSWPLWQKIIFRFFFIYFFLISSPWTWISYIPGTDGVLKYYTQFMNWSVNIANDKLFHVREVLVPINGSGDTSYGWAELLLFLCAGIAGSLAWSLLDIKRRNYNHLSYWFCIVVRYFIIINCFSYGIIKLLGLQMPFPNLSQLSTPLGDLLPMRLSWMFMGYSFPYQFFSGAMEVLAGSLMLFRRTSTFGTLIATGVFANVMMLNLGYDIPVKLYSTELFIMCLVLLAYEHKRILSFVFNRAVTPGSLYQVSFPKKWMRITRVILKLSFIVAVVILPSESAWTRYKQFHSRKELKPIKEGIYEVRLFVVNNDTIPSSYTDSLRWQDIIFERGGRGSVKTTDTMFLQFYRRGYFTYTTDTANKTIEFKRSNSATGGSIYLFRLNYEIPDSNTIRLFGKIRKDSVNTELKKTNRHFQLAEKQFHWLSEYNR